MSKYVGVIFALIFFCGLTAHASEYGFVPGGFYLSEENPSEGAIVTLYAGLFNNSDKSFSVTVNFYDRIIYLGTRDVTVLPHDSQLSSIEWKVSAGTHSFGARLEEPTLIDSTGKRTSVYTDQLTITGPSITIAKTVPGESLPYASDPAVGTILGQINKLEQKLGALLPQGPTARLSNFFIGLEFLRLDLALQIRVAVDQAREKIVAFDTIPEKDKLSPSYLYVDRPTASMALFFFTMTGFILSHQLTFYILLLAAIIMALTRAYIISREIIRKYRKKHHSIHSK